MAVQRTVQDRPNQLLSGFKRAGPQAEQLEAQMDSGDFYRRILQESSSRQAFEQAVLATMPAEASQQPLNCSEPAAVGSCMASVVDLTAAADTGNNAATAPCPSAPHGAVAEDIDAGPSTAGLGSVSQIEILQPVAAMQAPHQPRADAGSRSAAAGPMPAYSIPASNIGFQMLRQAGWCEGTGLGAEGQGRQMPLEQSTQKGRQGLGAAEAAAAAAAATAAVRQQQQQQQQSGLVQQTLSKRQKQGKAPRIPLPEDSESFDTRVKRHRQVMQAEADDVAAKAIQQYIHRAFRDTTGEPTSDNNPLLRRNKLTASNPLL